MVTVRKGGKIKAYIHLSERREIWKVIGRDKNTELHPTRTN